MSHCDSFREKRRKKCFLFVRKRGLNFPTLQRMPSPVVQSQATKKSSVIKNQGGGEFCEEILTPNLHFNGLIEAQYLKARNCFLSYKYFSFILLLIFRDCQIRSVYLTQTFKNLLFWKKLSLHMV